MSSARVVKVGDVVEVVTIVQEQNVPAGCVKVHVGPVDLVDVKSSAKSNMIKRLVVQ